MQTRTSVFNVNKDVALQGERRLADETNADVALGIQSIVLCITALFCHVGRSEQVVRQQWALQHQRVVQKTIIGLG